MELTKGVTAQTTAIPDDIAAIAKIIHQDWKKIYFGAVPYLQAMHHLKTMQDSFFEDSAASIVIYFLANAGSWRGETARSVKAKLNQMLAAA